MGDIYEEEEEVNETSRDTDVIKLVSKAKGRINIRNLRGKKDWEGGIDTEEKEEERI